MDVVFANQMMDDIFSITVISTIGRDLMQRWYRISPGGRDDSDVEFTRYLVRAKPWIIFSGSIYIPMFASLFWMAFISIRLLVRRIL